MGKTTETVSPQAFWTALQRSEALDEQWSGRAKRSLAKGIAPDEVARQLVAQDALTAWQAKQLLAGVPLKLGNYRLIQLLDKTNWGRVYLGQHTKLARRVVISTLAVKYASQPELSAEFLADAQAVAELDHRNLLHIYDVDQDGERLFVVSEHIEGQTAEQWVEQSGPLAPDEAARWIQQAAEGLAHAHQRGLYHGDLLPRHVLVDGDHVIKIAGLGLSKLPIDQEPPGFAPPESSSALDLDAAPRHAADIYRLGAVFHYLVAGGAPGQAPLPDDIPPQVNKALTLMLEADPQKRPGAKPLQKALASWLETLPPVEVAVEEAPAEPSAGVVVVDEEPDVSVAGDGASGGFAISTRGRRPARGGGKRGGKARTAKKPGNPAPQAAAPAKTQATEKTTPASGATRSSRGLLIGGIAGGALVVIAAIVGVVMMLGRDDESQVAQTDTPSTESKTDQKADDLETDPPQADPLESDPPKADPLESDPPKADPPAAPDGATPAGKTPDSAGPVEPTKPAGGPTQPAGDPAKPAGDPAKPAGDPAKPAGDPAKPAGGPAKPAGDPAKPAGDPAKPAGDPAKPASKPDVPSEPDAKGQPPAVFAKFPTSVDLPELDGSRQILGPVALAEKQLCRIYVRGGEEAGPRGKYKYRAANANGGTALREWDVTVEPIAGGAAGRKTIAQLTHENNQLAFEWTPEAKELGDVAGSLRNCQFSFSTPGQKTHVCSLRSVTTVPPLDVVITKASSGKWNVPNPPDAENILVAITKLDGPVAKYTKEPEDPVHADKGVILLQLTEGLEEPKLLLRVATSWRGRSLQISVQPQLVFQKKPQRINKTTLPTLISTAENALAVGTQNLQLMKRNLQGQQARRNVALAQQASLLEQNVTEMTSFLERAGRAKTAYDQLEAAGAKLHFRVFVEQGDAELDLVKSE